MKKILTIILSATSIAASAQEHVSTEKLITSGDPTQIASGYMRCGALMHLLGNAAIKTNPDEGAGYIAIGQRYSTLYRNAVDQRTPEKKRETELLVLSLVKGYGEMAQSNAKRPLMLTDFRFCQKWSNDL